MIHLSIIHWRRCCHCNLSCSHFYPMPNQAFGGGIIFKEKSLFNQPHLVLFFNFIDFLLRHQFSTCIYVARNITCTGDRCWLSKCMESLWDIAQVKLVHCSGWQPEVSLRRCSPVRGIWSGRRRSGRASSTFLSQTHRSGPWATVGVFLRWECTWGSRWGRRREGECRLAPLLSHEKPQSGCRRLTSNIVTIRYNFFLEPVPIVITTTNPAKKQRVFSNTGCLNRNKKEN